MTSTKKQRQRHEQKETSAIIWSSSRLSHSPLLLLNVTGQPQSNMALLQADM